MNHRDFIQSFEDYLSGRETEIDWKDFKRLPPDEWNSILDYSARLGVNMLIYKALKDCDIPDMIIPTDIIRKLKREYLRSAANNTRLFYDAIRTIEALKEVGIPVIVLKGLCLAEKIYGDIALRPMVDIDLLVKKEDLAEAGELLLSLGYRQDVPSWERMAIINHHLPPFYSQGRVGIELHWNLVQPSSPVKVDIDGLWGRAGVVKIEGVEACVLSTEDMLLYLCIHVSSYHKFRVNLIPFCDIARIINKHRDEVVWKAITERAHQWGAVKCVYLTLLLTQRFFNLSMPDNFINKLRPDDFNPVFLDEAEGYIFVEVATNPHTEIMASKVEDILRFKKPLESFTILLRRVFCSREIIAREYLIPVSSLKIYFYYPLRWLRLVKNYSRLLRCLLLRDRPALDLFEQERKRNALCRWMAS